MRRGKNLKRQIAILTIMIVCFCGSQIKADANSGIQFINVSKNKVVLHLKQSQTIKVVCTKKGNKYKKYWKSNNSKIVKVSKKGRLVPKAKGKTFVTYYVVNKKTGKKWKKAIKVQVKSVVKIKKIQMSKTREYIEKGKAYKLPYTMKPASASINSVKFKSSNPKIASVDKYGRIRGRKKGNVSITMSVLDGKKQKIKRKIEVVRHLSKITSTMNQKKVKPNSSNLIKVQRYPKDAKIVKTEYEVDVPNIAEINSKGVLTTKSTLGPVKITVTMYDVLGHKKQKKITVYVADDKGLISKSDLDHMDLSKCKKLMIHAHPDDETLWGGGHLIQDDYLVVCITNGAHPIRAKEHQNIMSGSGDKSLMLRYPDRKNLLDGYSVSDWTPYEAGLKKDLQTILTYKDWDEIVTHNPEGEYGHQAHQKVNYYVTMICRQLRKMDLLTYFERYYKKDVMDTIPTDYPVLADDILAKKREMILGYKSQVGTYEYHYHMNPYEEWVKAHNWQ